MMQSNFTSEEVTVQGEYLLQGTLTTPNDSEKKSPAVLVVAGSGEVDRDGNVSGFRFKLDTYKELTEFVTGLGFAVLRYDKRGVAKSEGSYLETGMWDLVDDIGACVQFLRGHPRVDPDRVILLGHSEGCLLISAYSAQNPVSGIVLLAGAVETIEEALQRQRKLLYGELLGKKGVKGWLFRLLKIDQKGEKQAQRVMGKIRRTRKDVARIQLVKMNAKWLREHLAYNVREDLPKVTCPILAVTGSKDVQSDPNRLPELPGLAGGEATWEIIKNMNHPLKEANDAISITQVKALYKDSASKPLHQELKETLARWLLKHAEM